jgi:3-hydroxyacyl-CoA dehydrogenase/3a,7a,12a-trihydroxy-5b-cholest-24-enoyl-CoA hydratase
VGETYPGQAFLYRLSADVNPLHIDPEVAKSQRFEKPIIHGLATYGTIGRVISQELFDNDDTLLKEIQVRFVGHVFPGENIDILVWKAANNMLIYEASVQGRGTKAAIGYVLCRETPKL